MQKGFAQQQVEETDRNGWWSLEEDTSGTGSHTGVCVRVAVKYVVAITAVTTTTTTTNNNKQQTTNNNKQQTTTNNNKNSDVGGNPFHHNNMVYMSTKEEFQERRDALVHHYSICAQNHSLELN